MFLPLLRSAAILAYFWPEVCVQVIQEPSCQDTWLDEMTFCSRVVLEPRKDYT